METKLGTSAKLKTTFLSKCVHLLYSNSQDYNLERKVSALMFISLMISISIFLATIYSLKAFIQMNMKKIIFFLLILIFLHLTLYFLKLIKNLPKIFFDGILCSYVIVLTLAHTEIFLKNVQDQDALFFLGLLLQTLNVVIYFAKVDWIFMFSTIMVPLGYKLVILLSDDSMVEVAKDLIVPLFATHLIFFWACHTHEKVERSIFYEQKKIKENLQKYEKLINEIFPHQILIFNAIEKEILFTNSTAQDFFQEKCNIKLLSLMHEMRMNNFRNQGLIMKNHEKIQNFEDLYDLILKTSNYSDCLSFDGTYNEKNSENSLNYFSARVGPILWNDQPCFFLILNNLDSDLPFAKVKDIEEYKIILFSTIAHNLKTPSLVFLECLKFWKKKRSIKK